MDFTRLADKKVLRVAGIMSGTSADGMDVAIVDIPARGRLRQIAAGHFPYPAAVRREVFELFDASRSSSPLVCRMNFVLGELYARAVIATARKARVPLASIHAVGSHGQTVWHEPPRPGRVGATLQIGEPAVIAERTGIPVVADFRVRDVAAGGQGAPLVPYADYVLLSHRRLNTAVQNIGGIANVTYLPAGGGLADVRAFDTGPGNMMIDRAAWLASGGRCAFDRGGRLAALGNVSRPMLSELMREPFLRRRPPKSTGRELFGVGRTDELWRRWVKSRRMLPADLVATLTAFTAASIAQAHRRFLGKVDRAIICGGGVRNNLLMEMLSRELAPATVMPIEAVGIASESKEAISFAILAAATLRGRRSNVPSATGARWPVVLGKIVPA
jgi:anhydro-N-acetylmuramic acid kinase